MTFAFFRNIYSVTQSVTAVILIFLLLIIVTRLFWGYHTKGKDFFSEFKSYSPLLHFKEIVKDPLGAIYRPLSDYLTLFFCLTFSFLAGQEGLIFLSLSVFIAVTGSPLKFYAIDFLLFSLINYMFVVARLRYSEEHRNRIYKKFGKPFVDQLVGNDPADKLEIAKTALTLAAPALLGLINNHHQANQTAVQNEVGADTQKAQHAHEIDKQREDFTFKSHLARQEASGKFASSGLQTMGQIAASDMPPKEKVEIYRDLKEAVDNAYRDSQLPSISYGVVVDQQLKATPAIDSHDQPTESDNHEEQEEEGDGEKEK